MDDYSEEVERVEAYNQPILAEFGEWLEKAGLAKTTLKRDKQEFLDAVAFDEDDDDWF